MSDNSREVQQAAHALTAELIKLAPLVDEQQGALAVTIENAISRLAAAIVAQSKNTPEACPTELAPAGIPGLV